MPNSHDWLAYLKLSLGDPAGALPHAETAAQLQRNSAQVQLNLGRAREGTGDPDGAVAAYDEALRLDPNNAYARAARTRAQRDRDLYLRLPDIVAGKEEPKTASAGCRLAMLCARQRKRYTTSVRLFESAFATDPSLAEDLKAAHRYNAACFAALAAAGEDEDSTKLDDNERARLRKQALAWLRADLILRTRQLQSGQGSDSADGRSALRHWQQDTDLASLRDEAALAKLRPDDAHGLLPILGRRSGALEEGPIAASEGIQALNRRKDTRRGGRLAGLGGAPTARLGLRLHSIIIITYVLFITLLATRPSAMVPQPGRARDAAGIVLDFHSRLEVALASHLVAVGRPVVRTAGRQVIDPFRISPGPPVRPTPPGIRRVDAA